MTDLLATLAAWLLVIGLAVLTVIGIWVFVVVYIVALS
jgi:hypothetical protein